MQYFSFDKLSKTNKSLFIPEEVSDVLTKWSKEKHACIVLLDQKRFNKILLTMSISMTHISWCVKADVQKCPIAHLLCLVYHMYNCIYMLTDLLTKWSKEEHACIVGPKNVSITFC